MKIIMQALSLTFGSVLVINQYFFVVKDALDTNGFKILTEIPGFFSNICFGFNHKSSLAKNTHVSNGSSQKEFHVHGDATKRFQILTAIRGASSSRDIYFHTPSRNQTKL